MDKEKGQEEKMWIQVDIEALSRSLAEDAWSQEMKDIPELDKWTTDVVQRGSVLSVERCIHERWANKYFAIKEEYRNLVMLYSKPYTYEEVRDSNR